MPLDVAIYTESVSKTHALDEAVVFAGKLHARFALHKGRSHHALRSFIAGLGLAVREARRDPQTVNIRCRKAGIKGQRLEVRLTRLIAGRRTSKQDQTHRWANAACYVARPCNGDVPPPNWREALRYVYRRGGERKLSDLYAKRASQGEADDLSFACRDLAAFYDVHGKNSSVEWYTPQAVFAAMGHPQFDLDPASPGATRVPWIRAKRHYTIADDGLTQPWFGFFVWLNPPYGRWVLLKWVAKFIEHGNGIILVPERTSTQWWQSLAARADVILCINQKLRFVRGDDERVGQFPIGTHLVGIGDDAVRALIRAHRNGLGMLLTPAPEMRLEREARKGVQAPPLAAD
jgi:hypothetical protein